ncbi:uncharacterized protein LOC106650304 [Trichogramma pretiosum]|uniref:uncharacterized protein LOC106650304 n=1 Tax=Trichogramma pretiosum TaxID=7493 RepID=UPI0006C94021|nr:uncharacterized protein LOC106650304 [Trichogramma pretiosum]
MPRVNVLLAVLLLALAAGCNGQVYTGAPAYVASSSQQQHETQAAPAVTLPGPIEPSLSGYTTQTVYGFLDFTTTLANTVMIFSPSSAPPEGSREGKSESGPIETKPSAEKKPVDPIQPSKTRHDSVVAETRKDDVQDSFHRGVVYAESEKTAARIDASTVNPAVSTVVEVRLKDDVPGVKNNLAEPEYDFLSKQPTEVVDETYKVINLRPSAKHSKPRATQRRDKENVTGFVTKLGGTIIKDGLTTVHETNVIGTYINGKYAQVLQSSSRVLNAAPAPNGVEGQQPGGKIRPSASQRILKTAGPLGKIKKQQQQQLLQQQQQHGELEPTTPVTAQAADESSQQQQPQANADEPITNKHGQRRRLRPKIRKQQQHQQNNVENVTENESGESTQSPQHQFRPNGKVRPNGNRPGGYKARQQQQQQQQQSSSVGTTTTEAPSSSGGTRRRSGFRPPTNQPNNPAKSYKTNKQSHSEQQSSIALPSQAAKAKLPRTQGRWSYKTTPKPRIIIRKKPGGSDDDVQLVTEQSVVTSVPSLGNSNPGPQYQGEDGATPPLQPQPVAQRKEGDFDGELDESESEDSVKVSVEHSVREAKPAEKILPVETLNVEISTAADFNDIYYEIATLKSPYEFQVGNTRNTRYVTVTSTYKKSFASASAEVNPSSVGATEPLTENILANTGAAYESSLPLDSSIATLPPISIDASAATPPLETITETFSTTQTLLKTYLLPVVQNNSTSRLTLVQTYNVARVVTATKTLPPAELYQFVPSKTLNEFNSRLDEAGSELHLELDFGDDESDDDDAPKRIVAPSTDLDSDLDIFKGIQPSSTARKEKSTSTIFVTESASSTVTPEQAQQLALFKLLGGSAPQVITTSKPVIVMETVYDTHVIPLINGGHTFFSTLSRPVATRPITTYEIGTSTIVTPMPPLPPTLPQVPQLPLFPPPQQPQFTVTSAPLVQPTIATVSESKVLKLTFGAKTAYTTLYSTRLVPTEMTTYVTSTIALPTVAAYPGYFPPAPVAYPGYPYVG